MVCKQEKRYDDHFILKLIICLQLTELPNETEMIFLFNNGMLLLNKVHRLPECCQTVFYEARYRILLHHIIVNDELARNVSKSNYYLIFYNDMNILIKNKYRYISFLLL